MRELKVDVVMLGASGRDFVCDVMGHFQPRKGIDGGEGDVRKVLADLMQEIV